MISRTLKSLTTYDDPKLYKTQIFLKNELAQKKVVFRPIDIDDAFILPFFSLHQPWDANPSLSVIAYRLMSSLLEGSETMWRLLLQRPYKKLQ